MAANEMAFLDRLWHDWSPDYDASQDLAHAKECLRSPENRAAAIGYYCQAYDHSVARNETDELYAFEQAALGNVGPQLTLYLHGNLDGCISLDLVRDATHHLSACSRMSVIDGAGHFPHLEKPDEVNKQILPGSAPERFVTMPRPA